MPRPVVKHTKTRATERGRPTAKKKTTSRRDGNGNSSKKPPRVSVEVSIDGGDKDDGSRDDAPLIPTSSPVKNQPPPPPPRRQQSRGGRKKKPQDKVAAHTAGEQEESDGDGNADHNDDNMAVINTPERAQRGIARHSSVTQTPTHKNEPVLAKTMVPGSATPSEASLGSPASVSTVRPAGRAHRSSSVASLQRIQKTIVTPQAHNNNNNNNNNNNHNNPIESSVLSNFKTRSRKPSIMHMMDADLDGDLDLGDDLDDEHFLGSPEPDDESTPMKRRLSIKRDLDRPDQQRQHQQQQQEQSEQPEQPEQPEQQQQQQDHQEAPDFIPNTPPEDSGEDSRPVFSDMPSSPPRRLQDVFTNQPVPPQPQPSSETPRMTSDVVEDDHAIGRHAGVPPPLETPPRAASQHQHIQDQVQAHTLEPLTQSMLPPQSSSPTPPESTQDSNINTTATDVESKQQPQKRQPRKRSRGDNGKNANNADDMEHISTEQLRRLFLPQRKLRRRLRDKGGMHRGRADDNDDDDGGGGDGDEQDAYSLKSDEDELSFLPTTKANRATGARRGGRGRGAGGGRERKKTTKSVPPPKDHDAAGGGRKKAKNTYKSRHSLGDPLAAEPRETEAVGGEDKENDTPVGDEAAAPREETTAQTQTQTQTQARDDELQRQAKKFAEVWKWTMDFEDVKESSSPGR